MDTCIRDDEHNHSGDNHEWLIKTVNTKIVLCVGHADIFNISTNYPLHNPCDCRICKP